MGISVSRNKYPDVIVYVKAGDTDGRSVETVYTDLSDISVVLWNQNGAHSRNVKLSYPYLFQQQVGQTQTVTHKFYIAGLRNFGPVEKIELWRKPKGGKNNKKKATTSDGWYVERIAVESIYQKDCISIFPVHRWVYNDIKYTFHRYGVSLPQNDNENEIREKELDLKRGMYTLEPKIKGVPPTAKSLPPDEQFSFPDKWDVEKRKKNLLEANKLNDVECLEWETLEEIRTIYDGEFVFPACLDERDWQSDKAFGEQRLSGCCPTLIRLCTKIPNKLAVIDRMVEPFLENLSLEAAIELRRIFIIDLDILEDVPCEKGQVAAPIALFFLTSTNDLKPIAIQLFQRRSKDNPVFVPSDPPYTWQMAKMWYNHAEASYHQSWAHFGVCHFLLESIAICTHSNLSSSHPIFKILAPHFVHIIPVNNQAMSHILSPGGWMDTCTNIGIQGMNEIIRRGFAGWKLNVNGNVQRDLQNRGVLDVNLLPHYAYRNDAMALDGAIRRYVRTVLSGHYRNMEDIEEDPELQKWRQELVGSPENGGAALQGVPGYDSFGTLDELVNTATSILFLCSVYHAAVTGPQYDHYGYPPNYPTFLKGSPPKKKSQLKVGDIVKALPTKDTTVDVMAMTKIFSTHYGNHLSEYEVQFLYDPVGLSALRQFRNELRDISKSMNDRNRKSHIFHYPYLHPAIVPNSVCI
ncbi:polyunsaturated fatty acid lipoxygenase ALOX15B-like [Ptychodera flava]|uniref:polyunsaturated fatty acid lipoxygenase ALOX15B-like n=1 Tax=Ptychodera flava TaxID=63121 RepID=UPI00396A1602